MSRISQASKVALSLALALALVFTVSASTWAAGPDGPGYRHHGQHKRIGKPHKSHRRRPGPPRHAKVDSVDSQTVVIVQPLDQPVIVQSQTVQSVQPVVERSFSVNLDTERGMSVSLERTVIK